jgi:translation elongation factor EF-G
MGRLMAGSRYVRNFIIVGSLQVGKTTFIRSLIYGGNYNENHNNLYIRNDEILMRTNLILNPCPLILKLDGQFFFFNIVDTPGHIELVNEVQLALSLSDGVVVFLDTWEGLNLLTRVLLKYFSLKKYKFFFIFAKIDRLMFELRLPPFSVFTKIKLELTKLNSYNNEINPSSPIEV